MQTLRIPFEQGQGTDQIVLVKQLLQCELRGGVPSMALEFMQHPLFGVGALVHIKLGRGKEVIMNFAFVLMRFWYRKDQFGLQMSAGVFS